MHQQAISGEPHQIGVQSLANIATGRESREGSTLFQTLQPGSPGTNRTHEAATWRLWLNVLVQPRFERLDEDLSKGRRVSDIFIAKAVDATRVRKLTHRKSWPNEAIEDSPFAHGADLYNFLVCGTVGF